MTLQVYANQSGSRLVLDSTRSKAKSMTNFSVSFSAEQVRVVRKVSETNLLKNVSKQNNPPTIILTKFALYKDEEPGLIDLVYLAGDKEAELSRVEVFHNGKLVEQSKSAQGAVRISALNQGDHQIIAIAYDAQGAMGKVVQYFTIRKKVEIQKIDQVQEPVPSSNLKTTQQAPQATVVEINNRVTQSKSLLSKRVETSLPAQIKLVTPNIPNVKQGNLEGINQQPKNVELVLSSDNQYQGLKSSQVVVTPRKVETTVIPIQLESVVVSAPTREFQGKDGVVLVERRKLAPTVQLTSSPINNLIAPAQVTLEAQATDSDGRIAKVDFYEGAVLKASVTTSPYRYLVNTLTVGTYAYKVIVTDNEGLTVQSNAIQVIVNKPANKAPTVQLTSSPINNLTAPAQVTLEAKAADSDGQVTKVDFYEGAVLKASVTASPYRYVVNTLTVGTYAYKAIATDNEGLVVQSNVINVAVNKPANKAPTVQLTSSPINNLIAPAQVTLEAQAADSDGQIAKVDFYEGAVLKASVTSSPYRYVVNTLTVGTYAYKVIVTDNEGLTVQSNVINVVVNKPANKAPIVQLTSSPINNLTAPAQVTLEAQAADSDGQIAKVDFYEGAVLKASVTASPYRYVVNTLTVGTYAYKVIVTDNEGVAVTSNVISVTVNKPANKAPTVQLTSSPINNLIAPAQVTLEAQAADSDGQIAKVDFYEGAVLKASVTASPYRYVVNTLTVGTYAYKVIVTDNEGLTVQSNAIQVIVNKPPNKAPTVQLTSSPINNLTAPSQVTLEAQAADSDGQVAKVDFYEGAVLKASVTTSPYRYTVNALGTGTYAYKVIVTDNEGLTVQSNAIQVIVNKPANKAPTVQLTSSPINNLIAPATVTLEAQASDSDGSISKVELYEGTVLKETLTTAPYKVTRNSLVQGVYAYKVVVTDNEGLAVTSNVITVMVNKPANKAPSVQLTSSPINNLIAPASVTLEAQASDSDGSISKVELYEGTVLKENLTAAPYKITRNNLLQGTYAYKVIVTDNEGLAVTSNVISVTVNKPANKAPTVQLTSSPINNLTAPAQVTLEARAADSDGQIAKVDFYEGAVLKVSVTASPYRYVFNALGTGTYAYKVIVTDNEGLTVQSNAIQVIVNKPPNKAPTVQLTSSPINNLIAPAQVTLEAQAADSDGQIAKVDFYEGAVLKASVTTNPYRYVVNTLTVGTYAYKAIVTDNEGLTVQSNAIQVIVNKPPNKAPTVQLTSSPINNLIAPAQVTLEAQAADSDGQIAKVDFYEGTVLKASVTTSPYRYTVNTLGTGTYAYKAVATDNEGLTVQSNAIQVIVNKPPNKAPTVQLTSSPINNLTAPAQVTLEAQAADSDGQISKVDIYKNDIFFVSLTTNPYRISINLDKAGQYKFEALAFDNEGVFVKSNVYSIQVNEKEIVESDSQPLKLPSSELINPFYSIDTIKTKTVDWATYSPLSQVLGAGTQAVRGPIPLGERVGVEVSNNADSLNPLVVRKYEDGRGGWDDLYVSGDNGHSNVSPYWIAPDGVGYLSMSGKYIHVPLSYSYTSRKVSLGINFASFSTTGMGHQAVMGGNNFFSISNNMFLNFLVAGPAYLSYIEGNPTDPKYNVDSYDHLNSMYHTSIGQSGSEVQGIFKMMVAGSAIPYETKRLLKSTGNYIPTLLYIFRATLPYADEMGKELPYAHESRHRVAYLSNGGDFSTAWFPHNINYHRYDETEHIKRMVQMASEMVNSTPPQVVMKVVPNSVSGGDLKTSNAIVVRLWSIDKQTVSIKIDLRDSYDLKREKLAFTVKPVYENQKNITISADETGYVYTIEAKYDAQLPLGRQSVIITANNGVYDSNPAFVNFYFPRANQKVPVPYFVSNDTSALITYNLRPEILNSTQNTIVAKPGEMIKFKLECKDPEGYSTKWWRWSNQPGTIENGEYSWKIPESYQHKVQVLDFICSDGTGGFNSIEKMIVLAASTGSRTDYKAVDIGNTVQEGKTSLINEDFVMTGSGSGWYYRDPGYRGIAMNRFTHNGHYLFTQKQEFSDLKLNVMSVKGNHNYFTNSEHQAQVGIIYTDKFNEQGYSAALTLRRNDLKNLKYPASATFHSMTDTIYGQSSGFVLPDAPYLRLIYNQGRLVYLSSNDGQVWEQMMKKSHVFEKDYYVGAFLAFQNGSSIKSGYVQAEATGKLIDTDKSRSLPVFTLRHMNANGSGAEVLPNTIIGSSNSRLNFSLASGESVSLRFYVQDGYDKIFYTQDGSTPSSASTQVPSSNTLVLSEPGDYKLRLIAINSSNGQVKISDEKLFYVISSTFKQSIYVLNNKESIQLKIESPIQGQKIVYANGDINPTQSSLVYNSDISYDQPKNYIIRAMTIDGQNISDINRLSFKIITVD